ncbi:MAG TPA: hypothetical protein VG055_32675 [Planctomycetaceae bacterium]|nr:hypothetical protein [Planctomycetaceae bacterium]
MNGPPLSPHGHAQDLASEKYPKLNEADTRDRIIDRVLHDVLYWPRSSVTLESFIKPGYSDYVLLGRHNGHLLFIKAKKTGVYFTLPTWSNPGRQGSILEARGTRPSS